MNGVIGSSHPVAGATRAAAGPAGRAMLGASHVSRRLLEMSGVIASALARAATLPTARGARMRAQAASFGVLGADVCAVHGIKVVVSGAVPTEPCFIVGNHVGYLDPIAIASVVPCTAIAKQEIDGWPLIGNRARELGIVFIKRDDAMSGARVLKTVISRYRHGVSVLNFPEGSTTRGDFLLPLRRGIFGAARLVSAPVVPVRVDLEERELAWVGDDAFVPHYLKLAARPSTVVRLRFGAPLLSERFASAEALSEAAREFLARRSDLS